MLDDTFVNEILEVPFEPADRIVEFKTQAGSATKPVAGPAPFGGPWARLTGLAF